MVLAPLLYPEKRDIPMDRILPDSGELAKTIMESSLAEFMQEVGYGFCARYDFGKCFFHTYHVYIFNKFNFFSVWCKHVKYNARCADRL